MKTVLVNPGKHYYAARAIPKGARVSGAVVKYRTRNPSLGAPMPPVVLMNPRRRRSAKRRRVSVNPGYRTVVVRQRRRRNPAFDIQAIARTALYAGVAGGGSYLVNKLLISQLGTTATGADTPNGMILRQGARLLLAAGGAWLMPGQWGSAWAGAMFYPFFFELDGWWRSQRGGAATSAASATRQKNMADDAAAAAADAGTDGKVLDAELEAELEAALGGYSRAA
jgi:hypothetical protein